MSTSKPSPPGASSGASAAASSTTSASSGTGGGGSGTSMPVSGLSTPATTPPQNSGAPQNNQPVTQQKRDFRKNWPAWMKQLPQNNFPPPDPNFQLIDKAKMRELLKDTDPNVVKRLEEDMEFLEHELLRLFRDRDYEAKLQQNRYRQIQIFYTVLAFMATLIGGFQALSLNSNPTLVPLFAFAETVVALFTTLLATISGREPPMQLWLANRRRAEQLRREYFMYVTNVPPYDQYSGYRRKMMLSTRVANINRGIYPDEPTEQKEG